MPRAPPLQVTTARLAVRAYWSCRYGENRELKDGVRKSDVRVYHRGALEGIEQHAVSMPASSRLNDYLSHLTYGDNDCT